jgi:hypothetical protein
MITGGPLFLVTVEMLHKNSLRERISCRAFCAVMSHFGGNLQYSEIPKYKNHALWRGQKTVRHSEISNYRKIELRKILSNSASIVNIRHTKLLHKASPRHRRCAYCNTPAVSSSSLAAALQKLSLATGDVIIVT